MRPAAAKAVRSCILLESGMIVERSKVIVEVDGRRVLRYFASVVLDNFRQEGRDRYLYLTISTPGGSQNVYSYRQERGQRYTDPYSDIEARPRLVSAGLQGWKFPAGASTMILMALPSLDNLRPRA